MNLFLKNDQIEEVVESFNHFQSCHKDPSLPRHFLSIFNKKFMQTI